MLIDGGCPTIEEEEIDFLSDYKYMYTVLWWA